MKPLQCHDYAPKQAVTFLCTTPNYIYFAIFLWKMVHCMAPSCTNGWRKTKGTGITYHRLPSGKLKDIWLQKIRRQNPCQTKYSYVCSEHFTSDCFNNELKQKTLNPRRILKPDAIPTIFAHFKKDTPALTTPRRERQRRRESRKVCCKLLNTINWEEVVAEFIELYCTYWDWKES